MTSNADHLHFAVLAYPNMTGLDLTGPFEVFATAALMLAKPGAPPAFRCAVIGLDQTPIRAESGLTFVPDYTLENCPPIDTLMVPGGCGLREPDTNQKIAQWLRVHHGNIRRIASTCTGIYGVAAAGLLDHRTVTTHWNFANDVMKKFPSLNLQADAIYIRDGKFYTSAGITAGIDLSLALIEEDFGAKLALAVARDLVVYLRRSGGQSQYSEPLQFQAKSSGVFSDLIAWIHANLKHDLNVAVLAERAGLGVRQFNRRFQEQFDCTPAHYVETARLNEARQRLLHPSANIDRVAESLGFRSADVFRRAFFRRYGCTPSDYQRHFASEPQKEFVK